MLPTKGNNTVNLRVNLSLNLYLFNVHIYTFFLLDKGFQFK